MEFAPINGWRGWTSRQFDDIFSRLPLPATDRLRVLGVTFDCVLNFREQAINNPEKAKVKLAVVAKVAGSTWGLEASVLRLTRDAFLVRLAQYGIVLVGSGLFEQQLSSIETGVTNIAARKITGTGRSARLMALHAAAGVASTHNLFALNCALSFDRDLPAGNSARRDELLRRLEAKRYIAGGQ